MVGVSMFSGFDFGKYGSQALNLKDTGLAETTSALLLGASDNLLLHCAFRLLRCSRLVGIEILTYAVYIPVSALRPPCNPTRS
jgi:hypothetical protein